MATSSKFSVDQANAMLPLVGAIARDLAELALDVEQQQQRLEKLTLTRELEADDPYDQEVAAMIKDLQRDRRRLDGYRRELKELGVRSSDQVPGAVDFPSDIDGKLVYLCWQLGEAELLYYRLPHEEPGRRRRLAADSAPQA